MPPPDAVIAEFRTMEEKGSDANLSAVERCMAGPV